MARRYIRPNHWLAPPLGSGPNSKLRSLEHGEAKSIGRNSVPAWSSRRHMFGNHQSFKKVAEGTLGRATLFPRPDASPSPSLKPAFPLAQPSLHRRPCPTSYQSIPWPTDTPRDQARRCPTPWQSPSATPQAPGPRSGTAPGLGLHSPARATDSQSISTSPPPVFPSRLHNTPRQARRSALITPAQETWRLLRYLITGLTAPCGWEGGGAGSIDGQITPTVEARWL